MNEFLTTSELAELLRIKERKVYDLASSGKIPCSRATGKLLFPRREIDRWIAQNVSGETQTTLAPTADLILGSHDPLLDWAIRESRCGLACLFDSSEDGLTRFKQGEGIATGLHLLDADSDQWNLPAIEKKFSDYPVVLVNWAKRQRGIIVEKKNATRFPDLSSLQTAKVVPRQAEAGSQILIQTLLKKHNIESQSINWQEIARSENDAVLQVRNGQADATFGLRALASQYQLGFIPIIEERFDLLVDRQAWFSDRWQIFAKFCHSETFKTRLSQFDGFDCSDQFSVYFNGPR